ncbi:MAG TPA: EF-hand domain-containing protein [Verrucomicrobiae bacterium]|nr:EF-hand domain-containing protein [Verrucomicrobiae bacterium]
MRTTLAMLALGVSALAVNAQDAGGPPDGQGQGRGPGGHHRPPPLPLVQAIDANHDGVIDADEMANAAAALKTLDKNSDGKLTADEIFPARPADAPADAPKPPAPPIVKALDANNDGVIDADEIANASAALKTLDKNSDGQLSRDEFCPPAHFGMRGQHRHDGAENPQDGPSAE